MAAAAFPMSNNLRSPLYFLISNFGRRSLERVDRSISFVSGSSLI
ncbi:hypothetical protein T05_3560 [Trichinella murrelli]|uniref:Uncharacterized protein n=1 Tax=Trichinella murrelli TaxID=144512 RepID=A0A0V0SPI3_9BILA|nr:hypothetical protein T05_3560 [Trichinella murrelli]